MSALNKTSFWAVRIIDPPAKYVYVCRACQGTNDKCSLICPNCQMPMANGRVIKTVKNN